MGSSDQPSHIQIFHNNRAVNVHQFSGFFVMKIAALIRHMRVCSLQQNEGFTITITAFLSAALFAARNAQLLLCSSTALRILNGGAVGQRGKAGQSEINSDSRSSVRQRFRLAFHAKAYIPAIGLPLDVGVLNGALNWPVQFSLNLSRSLNADFVVVQQLAAISIKRECDAVVALERLKSRIAWFLAAFYASEEGRKGTIESSQHVQAAGKICKPDQSFGTHWLQLIRLIVIADRLTASFPRVPAFLKGAVVQVARLTQLAVQKCSLRLSWVQAVFVRELQFPFSMADQPFVYKWGCQY